MNAQGTRSSDPALAHLPSLLPELEALYTDVHAHPELSMQETRTAWVAADRLRAAGYEVTTAIGKTGVVGLLRNGDGPVVMLRADMDALPVEETTGLPYASKARATDRDGKAVPVMHACGHDMHVTWLVGATTLLAQARDAWRGTLMAVFQPAEETAEGAQARTSCQFDPACANGRFRARSGRCRGRWPPAGVASKPLVDDRAEFDRASGLIRLYTRGLG